MTEVSLFSRAWNSLREYGFRSIIRVGQNIFFRRTFKLWERLGIHVTPVHFYQPIPDARDIALRKKIIWKNSELVGIDMNDEVQLKFLREIFPKYYDEYTKFPKYNGQTCGFSTVDAEVLHCMVRYFKPSKIIEIGSGFSTFLFIKAIEANKEKEKKKSRLTVIDPHPPKQIQKALDNSPNCILIQKKCEDLDINFFLQLESNDILFIDSTHVVKIGGEVNYLYLEILPRLNKGVIIHAHDIFIPLEYPKDWVLKGHRFWTEQYLLHAFLIYNNAFEVLFGGSYIHINYSKELKSIIPSYDSQEAPPGSFWIRKIKKGGI